MHVRTMNITLPSSDPSDPTNTYTFNGLAFTPNHLSHPLLFSARTSLPKIDTLLQRPNPTTNDASPLSSQTLPTSLEASMKAYTTTLTTPGVHGGGIRSRPRWFYANCAVYGTLLGRAFTLLSTPSRPPKSLALPDFPFARLPAELRLHIYAYYKHDLLQRCRYWAIMTRVFIKALWSGREPEEGACYTTGIIMLTAGHAMSLVASQLRGRGTRYIWWDDSFADAEHTWGWDELSAAIYATRDRPRNLTDITRKHMYDPSRLEFPPVEGYRGVRERLEYVSRQVLEVYDLAREHLRADERDWTPPEIEARLVRVFFESAEARAIWEGTGMVPRVFEEKYVGEESWSRGVHG
ncbi:hypothetical protein K458DRAFT_193078 [Lentithecium fluviatile CBS 122367]|uniref:Uncharacterized protein n=1 Tax=Lentithecium fluviatile CBS 122367 TaxID=1168545 RepID=A0A6G1IDU6_9PLEO|nr:hypothetical protein K458DRAFT_193078 [Lentithecium fluviatile CBS 122367]